MLKKLLSVSNIFACVTFILSLITLILYLVNINIAGYYQGVRVSGVVVLLILVMVFDCLIIARSLLKFEGIVDKVLDLASMALKVLVPLFLMITVLLLAQSRIEGLGYIFFSNEDVAKEVATPENIASANTAIVTIVFGAVAAVLGIVGAFFSPKKD